MENPGTIIERGRKAAISSSRSIDAAPLCVVVRAGVVTLRGVECSRGVRAVSDRLRVAGAA